jgi:hypothetical protein
MASATLRTAMAVNTIISGIMATYKRLVGGLRKEVQDTSCWGPGGIPQLHKSPKSVSEMMATKPAAVISPKSGCLTS